MKIPKRMAGICAVAGLLSMGTAFAVPALASTPTTCSTAGPGPAATNPAAPNSGTNTSNAGACDVQGTATIPEVLAFESDASSFTFPHGIDATPTNQFAIYVYANSVNGYYVSEQLTSPFAGDKNASDILAASNFTVGITQPPASCNGVAADTSGNPVQNDAANDGMSTVFQIAASPCPSHGRDFQNNANGLVPPAGMPAGTDRFSILGYGFPSAQLLDGTAAPAQNYSGDFTMAAWA